MRLMIVSPHCPWPPDEGASIRIMGLADELARTHEVTLVTAVRKPGDREGVERLRSRFARVEAAQAGRGPLAKLRDMAVSYLTLTPYQSIVASPPELRRAVDACASGMDAAQGEFPGGARLIAHLPCRRVMDAHNVESDILRGNAGRARNPLRKLHHLLQSLFMRRFESRMAARMDAVLACSDEDRDFFRRVNPVVLTVPNAVAAVHERGFPAGRDVVFTGLMSYLANAEGVAWFRNEVWPRVRAALEGGRPGPRPEAPPGVLPGDTPPTRPETGPAARLWIVGKDPGPEVLELAGPDVTVTGRVSDVSEYLRRARVFVCPVRVGSGTRIKILEAFSYGVPVVSTALGCAGLRAENGRHLLVADEPEDFARAVLDLLRDDGLARRIGEAGRDLAAKDYTWEAVVRTVNDKVYQ